MENLKINSSLTLKKDVRMRFYIVETLDTFFILSENDVIPNSLRKEKKYNIRVAEYIGNYAGKDDVICIISDEYKLYQTYIDANTTAVCYRTQRRGVTRYFWKTNQNDSLAMYYDEFKKMGIKLKNDVYYHERLFRKAVSQQLI